ncbi:CBASS cGAMP synthase [Sphingomonas sp. ZB1N12]|uniref:CBASS cGAMP synthase n=1 Tax=Sphingomonas arabinosi TaxID=3096160 RepID=UPI002FC9CED7
MSFAARLFNSKSDQTLYSRITPSKEQFAIQQARWNDLRDFLKSRLKEDTEYPTSSWLQGSYKFDTQIRPWNTEAQFDIDLGLYFEWSGDDEGGEYDPEGFKQFVQNALLDYADDEDNDATGVDEPKERCCRISFNPDFHIDVPCYHLDRGEDRRALATETKGWEESDPKAIYKWFKELFEDAADRGLLRPLVCYMKMWAALKMEEGKRPSSITLTVLVGDALTGLDRSEAVDDDDVLQRIITAVADRVYDDARVFNPVDTGEDLNRLDQEATDGFRTLLRDFEDTARRANAATTEANAAEIWTEAFEHFFPMPEDLEGEADGDEARVSLAKGTALMVYAFDPQIRVRAVSKDNASYVKEGVNSLPTIVKNCSISFELVNADALPNGSAVRWTVRNRGHEAWNKNDIGHYSGDAFAAAEHSAYNGNHAMDLTVYQYGRIIGRRRIEIKVRGQAMPPRNLPNKRTFGRR